MFLTIAVVCFASVIGINRVDCLAHNASTFPDKKDKKMLSVNWLRRSDSILVPFTCPRIPKRKFI